MNLKSAITEQKKVKKQI